MLEFIPSIGQFAKRNGKPGFGLVNTLNDRGLGTESRLLESLFARHFDQVNFSIFAVPAGRRGQRFDEQWSNSRRFERWLGQQSMIMTIERFVPSLFDACAKRGIKTLWRPNQEWIQPTFESADLARIDCIMAPTMVCADLLRTRFGIADVLCNPWVLDRPVVRKQPGTGATRFLFNAGRGGIGDRRNARAVVAAFARILPRRRDIHLTIKTQSPVDVAPLAKLRLSNFSYIERNTSYSRNLSFYRAADFSVAPSKWEGVGFSLLESLYCGTPVLTTDAAPMNEWIRHAESGYLVPARLSNASLPIPYVRDNSEGLNWVAAAHCSVDDLTHGIEWMADNKRDLYRRFNAGNGHTLDTRLRHFTATFDTVLRRLSPAAGTVW